MMSLGIYSAMSNSFLIRKYTWDSPIWRLSSLTHLSGVLVPCKMQYLMLDDYESCWFDTSSYEDLGSYDNSYYLTYDHVEDNVENGECGSWLGDCYSESFECYLGMEGNETYNNDYENQWLGYGVLMFGRIFAY